MISRYRSVQKTSLEEYVGDVLERTPCKLCKYVSTCMYAMPEESGTETPEDEPCTMFDNTLDKIKEIYLSTQEVKSL